MKCCADILKRFSATLAIGVLLVFVVGCSTSAPSNHYGRTSIKAVFPPSPAELKGEKKADFDRELELHRGKISITFAETWTEKEITVLRPNRPALKIKASRSKAKVTRGKNVSVWPQLAFVCPDTGNTWIGLECSCYVETATGLYGLQVVDFMGRLEWIECAVVKEYAFKMPLFDDLMERYKKDVTRYYFLSRWPSFYYELKEMLPDYSPLASKIRPELDRDRQHFDHATMSAGILEYALRHTSVRKFDTLFIDVNASELIRFTRNGQQLFP